MQTKLSKTTSVKRQATVLIVIFTDYCCQMTLIEIYIIISLTAANFQFV